MTLTLERETAKQLHMKKQCRPVELGLERLLEEGHPRSSRRARWTDLQSGIGRSRLIGTLPICFTSIRTFNLRALVWSTTRNSRRRSGQHDRDRHGVDRKTGLPVHSLYSETREPTDEMLQDVDVLVFDMQDVGCRIYTFVYTLANCMRAARQVREESDCLRSAESDQRREHRRKYSRT